MDNVKISATSSVATDLSHAEMDTVSAFGLLEDVIYPMFHGYNCKGILEEYAKKTGGNLDNAARAWMEDYYDALYAAVYAVNHMVGRAADVLQMLPVEVI